MAITDEAKSEIEMFERPSVMTSKKLINIVDMFFDEISTITEAIDSTGIGREAIYRRLCRTFDLAWDIYRDEND